MPIYRFNRWPEHDLGKITTGESGAVVADYVDTAHGPLLALAGEMATAITAWADAESATGPGSIARLARARTDLRRIADRLRPIQARAE